MTHYTNHSVGIQDEDDSAAVIVGSLLNVSAPIDQEVQASATGGRFYPEQITIASQKPRLTFGSYDLSKVLTAFGLIGRRINGASGKVGVALYQAKYNDNILVAGSNHRRLRFDESFAMVRRISVSHRQDAQIESEVMALWDGINDPVIPDSSIALPALPASPGRWTLGDVTVGGESIGCNIQVDFDFGLTAEVFGCDSDIWDTHLNLNMVAPRITITSLKPEGFGPVVPLIGLAGEHADTVFYLRKRLARGAGFVADVEEEHIQITASGVLLVSDAHNASANQRAQASFQMECDWDGTNSPIVFDTTAALS